MEAGGLLTSSVLDDVRRFLRDGREAQVEAVRVGGSTLPAALELACAAVQWRMDGNSTALALVDAWSESIPLLGPAIAALGRRDLISAPATHSAPASELFAVQSAPDLIGTAWDLFRQRFDRSLRASGFSSMVAGGLSKALSEMADNIVQHSGPTESEPRPGLIAYHVAERWMTFAIADIGRGVLASLRTNPKWTSTKDSTEALERTVMEGRTRRPNEVSGHGFRDVDRAIVAELNGRLRYRTGDALLTLQGRGGALVARTVMSAPLLGFQLSVTAALDEAVSDLPLTPSI